MKEFKQISFREYTFAKHFPNVPMYKFQHSYDTIIDIQADLEKVERMAYEGSGPMKHCFSVCVRVNGMRVPRNIRPDTRTGYRCAMHDDDDSYEAFLIFPPELRSSADSPGKIAHLPGF